VQGIGDISPFFFLGQALGLLAFDFSGFLVTFKTRLDLIAFLQTRPGLAFVIMVAFPACDLVFDNVLFVGESNNTLFVLERRIHLNFIRRFRTGADSRHQKQTGCQGDNQHDPQRPFVHQLDTSLFEFIVTPFFGWDFYQLHSGMSTELIVNSSAGLHCIQPSPYLNSSLSPQRTTSSMAIS
jgi:hypothetical protein